MSTSDRPTPSAAADAESSVGPAPESHDATDPATGPDDASESATQSSADGPADADAPSEGAAEEAAPRPLPAETPLEKPARSVLSVRDMVVAIGVLIVIAVLFTRSCSFSPGGPSVSPDSAPTVDSVAALQAAAPRTPFALHVPALPAGWRANSSEESPIDGGGRAVRVGYLTAAGNYIGLVQSDAAEEALVATENGGPLAASGSVQAAGLTWVVYKRANGESIWVATEPGQPQSLLLLTGSAAEPDFRTLAQAAVDGERLPAGTRPS